VKQKYLRALLEEVLSVFYELNIPVSDRILPEIKINTRAKSRFGSCRKVWKGSDGKYVNRPVSSLQKPYFQIEICEAMLDADEQELKNVLAHELLHTCYGCYNHGKRWKAYAVRINNMYGYNITSTTTYEKIGLERPEKKTAYKYKIECAKCGKIFYRQRKSKLTENPGRYRCTCGGKLKVTEL
jgi:predicted SprT family Zn-dependent metalloprotease